MSDHRDSEQQMEEGPSIPSRYRSVTAVVLSLYWTALFIGTHIPQPEQLMPPKVSDKLLHFGAYGGLAFLLAFWQATQFPLTWRRLIVLFAIVACYGIADELIQIPVGRDCEILDWLADVGGAAIGLTVCAVWCRYFSKRR